MCDNTAVAPTRRGGIHTEGAIYADGLALLHAKYPQYATLPLAGHALLVIAVERRLSWRFTPEVGS